MQHHDGIEPDHQVKNVGSRTGEWRTQRVRIEVAEREGRKARKRGMPLWMNDRTGLAARQWTTGWRKQNEQADNPPIKETPPWPTLR